MKLDHTNVFINPLTSELMLCDHVFHILTTLVLTFIIGPCIQCLQIFMTCFWLYIWSEIQRKTGHKNLPALDTWTYNES